MKSIIVAAFSIATFIGGSLPAEACNPLLGKNYGKHIAPTALPAAMLAKAHYKGPGPDSIVGLWHDVHTASNGTLFLEGFDTWNRDGTENELGNLPPATGALCVGTWKKLGPNAKNAALRAHVTWLYDTSNNFVGTLDMTQQNKVSSDGNTYTGTFDAKFFDPSGNQFMEVTGTTAAERLVQN